MIPAGAPILSAAAMRAAEEACFARGVAQDALMEHAGAAVAREAARFAMGRRILVVAGPGNNGGDAYVAARLLRAMGHEVGVAALGEPKAGAAARMRALWCDAVEPFAEAQPRAVLVDGLFGTGMARPLDSAVAGQLQRLVEAAQFTLAIDLPSGIATDSGADLGVPHGINVTLALGALKPAHLLGHGLTCCGHVLLGDIGIPITTDWRTIQRPRIVAPAVNAHKYTRGLVVVVEGAMPGAARLAARAAAHAGAGYVVLATRAADPATPDAIVRRRIDTPAALEALLADQRVGAVAIGSGLGRDRQAERWLDVALASDRPLVVDGDALSLLGRTAGERLRARSASTVITPHSGEFAAMFESGPDKIAVTLAAAAASGATVVHKGPDTILATPEGQVRALAGASTWLSTAGTGDVLAGAVAARIAAGGDAAEAVWLHAHAAHLAGPAFVADDLVPLLSQAVAVCR